MTIMTLKSSTRFFNRALLAGAMALITAEAAVAQTAQDTADSSVHLVQTWDKTFPRSDKVDHQKVTFKTVTALRWPQMYIFLKIAETRSLPRWLFPDPLAR
jgi:catabolite regulation protein CreA